MVNDGEKTMIVGVELDLSKFDDAFAFSELFAEIDVQKYDWYIPEGQCEAWSSDFRSAFFTHDVYNGKELLTMFRRPCFCIFLKLQAYPHKTRYTDLRTYHEYICSDCRHIVLVSDCDHIEVYSKSIDCLEKIHAHFADEKQMTVEYITDSTDHRTSFDIL